MAKTTVKKRMPKTRQQTLDTGDDLWAVLTALRGPDNQNDVVKANTTARIRGVAFPKKMRAEDKFTIIRGENTVILYHYSVFFSHFTNHIQRAANALEMKVEDANQKLYI